MSDIKSWRMTAETAQAAREERDRLVRPRTLERLLTEWHGVGRHQTITFEGAARLVEAALYGQSEVRQAAAAMSDDELADALNWWNLRQSERGL